MHKKYLKYVVVVALLIIVSGCKGFKKSKVGKVYHNITAHYNPYFNGKEKLKEVHNNLFDGTDDNYANVLAIFPIGTEAGAKSAAADLEIVQKKAAKIINKHDVSDWVDDAYLLAGQAYYYKRDYFAAIESFQYIIAKFPKTEPAFLSNLWLIRCQLELNKLTDAQAQMTYVRNMKDFPEYYKDEFDIIQADYYSRNNEYRLAADRLEKGLKGVHSRKYKIRYFFILAQLYARCGKLELSSHYYHEVIKRLASFELSFQARMGLADTYSEQSPKNKKRIKRFLRSMPKDDKYVAYLDQVYYQIAKIDLQERNRREALHNLHLSTRKTTKNLTQKTLSYVLMAETYGQMGNYQASKMYYDSALVVVPKDFPHVESSKKRFKTMSDLSGSLYNVRKEDSLQALSKMPENDLKALIDKVIQQKKDEEVQKKILSEKEKADKDRMARFQENQQEMQNQQSLGLSTLNTGGSGGSTGSSTGQSGAASGVNYGDGAEWYFYNPIALASGASSFTKVFGNRGLQDDWRRKRNAIAPKQENNPENPKNLANGQGNGTNNPDSLKNNKPGGLGDKKGVTGGNGQSANTNPDDTTKKSGSGLADATRKVYLKH